MSLSSISGAISGVQSLSNTVSQGANLVGALASAVGLGGSKSKPTYWKDKLQKASFRGVPFTFIEGESEFGRESAVHKYPFRDGVWVEDLGRNGRPIMVQGFLVGDDCIAQREKMIKAVETADAGDLVHPTLGRKKVCCLKFSNSEKWDKGRVFALSFTFIEQTSRQFPTVATATGASVASAAAAAKAASKLDLLSSIGNAIKSGIAAVKQAISTVQSIAKIAQTIVNDATNLVNFVKNLPGALGRFVDSITGTTAGSNSSAATPASATVQSLVAQGTVARANVAVASNTLVAAASALQIATTASPYSVVGNIVTTVPNPAAAALQTYATATQGLVSSLAAAASTPRDAIRLLSNLIASTPPVPAALAAPVYPTTPVYPTPAAQAAAMVAGATGDLLRRSAVAELAIASSNYQPTSFDDAVTVQTQVTALIDAEIEVAGNQGQDASYSALRALRTAVVQDLIARGANLAPLMQVKLNAVMPALALAQRLYQDSTRSDELVSEANPIHPAFMPTRFQALAQ